MIANLVFDTSVWINLLATEEPFTIIGAFGAKCITPEEVVREITCNPITRQAYSQEKHLLRMRRDVQIVRLQEEERDLFLSLVAKNSTDALGDGEAAAIAVARIRRCAIAIDERKARRIIRKYFPEIPVLMTVDILRSPSVKTRLGEEALDAAFAKAVRFARMHVPKDT